MDIIYNTNHTISYNEFIDPKKMLKSPKYKISDLGYKYYTLIMYDPDAPSGNYFHWITRIYEYESEILPYIPPSPPKHEIHTYIIEVYGHNINLPMIPWNKDDRTKPLITGKEVLGLDEMGPILKTVFFSGYKGGSRKKKNTKRIKHKKYDIKSKTSKNLKMSIKHKKCNIKTHKSIIAI